MTQERRATTLTDGVVVLRPTGDRGWDVLVDGLDVGAVDVVDAGDDTGRLSWSLGSDHQGRGYATRAVRLLVDDVFAQGTFTRVEARVPQDDVRSVRLARRTGLRNEGVLRRSDRPDQVLLARLREDPEPFGRNGFRAMLNSFLPRTRVIAQVLVRDPDGRVLMCHPTYKDDWDLPGGVVERLESPHTAAGREVAEELSLTLPVGGLLLTDWLPPWGGWDDAVCLVFDGGVHDPAILDDVVLQAREIREVAFCATDDVVVRAADYTARRVAAALAALSGDGPAYTQSGRLV